MLEGSRGTIAIWAVAAVLLVLAGMRLVGGGEPGAEPVRIDRAGSGDAPRAATDNSRAKIYVHVAGAVRRPGLLRVPAHARVALALERAGGPTRRADLTLVNLAAPLQDGQQIVVSARGAGTEASGESGAAQIHLSTATVDDLDEIDGIGPTLAERIIEYRDEQGGFRSVDELSEVDGIGEKRLATLRDALQP